MTSGSIHLNTDIKERVSSFLVGDRKRKKIGDKVFHGLVLGTAAYTLFIIVIVVFSVGVGSAKIFSHEGFIGFVTGTNWNAVEGRESYGALPYIIGTLMSSGIALLIGVPMSLGIAFFLAEMAPSRLSSPLSFVIELLAAVPSIIYGLWALFVFRFLIKDWIETPLYNTLGPYIPFFNQAPFGLDVFSAGIVLAIMIIPIVSSISRDVIRAVPDSQREAAYALGATRWEVVKTAILPYGKSGLLGASFLGLGRAIGETILVTMVIGNAVGMSAIPTSLFSPSQTLSSIIANEFNEASGALHLSALIGLGLVLFAITLLINVGAVFIVSRVTKSHSNLRD